MLCIVIGKTQKTRSSCPEVFCKKGFLRSFAKFIGKQTMEYSKSISKSTFFHRTPLVAGSGKLVLYLTVDNISLLKKFFFFNLTDNDKT